MLGTMRWARTIRPALLGSVLLALGVTPGCDPCSKSVWTGQNSCTDCDHVPDRPAPELQAPMACDGSAWIQQIDEGKTCEDVTVSTPAGDKVRWDAAPLFPGAAGELATYCRVTRVGDADPSEPLTQSPCAGDPLGRCSEDCTFVTPQSDFTPWLHRKLVDAVVDATNETVARAPRRNGGMWTTRVTVLDTSPAAHLGQDRIQAGMKSEHGETLARLIQEVACEQPNDCVVDVRTRLVMPLHVERSGLTSTVQRDAGGGNHGSLLDVAGGLWDETLEYVDELAAASASPPLAGLLPTRRIYNMSFAWGDFDGGNRCDDDPHGSNDPMVKAVVAALDAAACTGALEIAAAGNHTGGLAGSQGLLCPARWSGAIHPDNTRCEEVLGAAPFQAIRDHFRAVLLARAEVDREIWADGGKALLNVGPTDTDRHPLAMSRPNACPDVAALGIGTARRPEGSFPSACLWGDSCEYFPFLIGSSVAAANVSSRLAAEWSQPSSPQSGSGPAEMREWVLDYPGERPDVNRRGGCGCDAAQAVCFVPWIGAPTPISAGSQNPQPPPDVRGTIQRAVQGFDHWTLDPSPVCMQKAPLCVVEATTALAGVHPVPDVPPCTRCVLHNSLPGNPGMPPELWVDKNSQFQAANVTRAVLVVEDPAGQATLTLEISASAFDPNVGGPTSLSKLAMVIPFQGARAWISVYDVWGGSQSQQILVVE